MVWGLHYVASRDERNVTLEGHPQVKLDCCFCRTQARGPAHGAIEKPTP
jgi:hypothetical protein